MINVIFQATLTADPQQDTRNTKNSAHVYLSLCGKLDAKDPNNEQYKKSLFIQGSVWGKLAELCMNNLKKGNHILVFGTLYDVSTNESNGKVYLNTSMNITSFEFLDRAGNTQNAQQQPAPQPTVTQQVMPPAMNTNNGDVQAPPWMQAGGAQAAGSQNLAAAFF